MNMEARIARLERENRRFRRIGTVSSAEPGGEERALQLVTDRSR